jgi:hypothetical protein
VPVLLTSRGNLPLGDVMLAQKLAFESFKVEAIKLAHVAPLLREAAEGVTLACR